MSHDFRQDYEALALDDGADWATARATYRRQVNLWHPDRYVQRPRERVHAQRRFIQLTRAFDALRAFHRANDRLPFEPIRKAAPSSGAAAVRGGATSRANGAASAGVERPSEEAVLEAGILNLRGGAGKRASRPLGRRLLWPAVGALVVLGTLAAFLVLDRNARRATLDEGREVLRRTERSEFMPSATEVKKQSSRGAFVEREDSGRIGDQLMEDVFK